MNRFFCCLKNDYLEIIRGKKNIICLAVALGCGAFVLCSTLMIPPLLQKGVDSFSAIMEDGFSADSFIARFFPHTMRASLGIFSADIGVFYSVFVIIFTYNLLPEEIESGKLIFPICAGHSKKLILLSKEIVYGILMSIPVFASYLIYYLVAGYYLENDCLLVDAICNAVVLAVSISAIVAFTIVFSVIIKGRYTALIIMISSVLALPDMMTFVRVGRYLPTYLLTFAYNTYNNYMSLLLPGLLLLGCLVVANIVMLCIKEVPSIDERR